MLIQEAVEKKDGLKWLIDSKVAQRLNIVFDIDHTLIFSQDARKGNEGFMAGSTHDTHLMKLTGGHEMVLVVRQGTRELLDFLSKFCTLYVYSHGVKEYIMKILDILDPEEIYFDRKSRVLAPENQVEQLRFKENGKSITDVVPKSELCRTLIIDDQYAVIKDPNNLLMSKKFMKYVEKLTTKTKQDELATY